MSAEHLRSGYYELLYGGERITFSVEFRRRRRVSITVRPDRTVTVLAPEDRTIEEILGQVNRRRAWIVRQRAYFEQFRPVPGGPLYVSGASHYYLGRQYRLRIRKSERSETKLFGRFFHVFVGDPRNPPLVAEALEAWYHERARDMFSRYLTRCLDSARSLGPMAPPLRIRRMHSRWGSCSKAGAITLNRELIKAPPSCIEYVIMHELCHLRVRDHGPRFVRLLSRLMPDWKRRKERLDRFILPG